MNPDKFDKIFEAITAGRRIGRDAPAGVAPWSREAFESLAGIRAMSRTEGKASLMRAGFRVETFGPVVTFGPPGWVN